jgi:hypothetical protein
MAQIFIKLYFFLFFSKRMGMKFAEVRMFVTTELQEESKGYGRVGLVVKL